MTLLDFLKISDFIGTKCVIYSSEDEKGEDPLYEGSIYGIPWYVSLYELDTSSNFYESPPIQFRHSLGEEYNNQPGFIFIVKE